MLAKYPLEASLPASDIERAKAFYRDKLGLTPAEETEDGGAFYDTGGARFMVYPSGFAGTNQATAAGWQVDDIESVVAGLTANGVVFQEYDFDELKTVDGIATLPNGIKGAWFTDSEGNILSLFQMA
ncbi:MAG: VOC family protein [Acidimicrobiia bacterium]|nr:MAG: VOC family protein [Acidimicrobiia bacterium]